MQVKQLVGLGVAAWLGTVTLPAQDRPVTLQQVLVESVPGRVTITLASDGPLAGTLADLPPSRIYLDLPGVVPNVPSPIEVGTGGVTRIRIALNRADPPLTRVVLDLEAEVSARWETGPDDAARLVIESPVDAVPPIAIADRTAPSPVVPPLSPAPLLAAAAEEALDYAEWVARIQSEVERLLATGAGPRVVGLDEPFDRQAVEWQALAELLERRTPPPGFGVVHDLVRNAVRLGALAGAEPVDQVGVDPAAAGATLLLERAVFIVRSRLTPPSR